MTVYSISRIYTGIRSNKESLVRNIGMGVKDKGKTKAKAPKVVARDFESGGTPQTPGKTILRGPH